MAAPVPSPSALVGRDRELASLRGRLASAVEGQGSLVLLSGEAGIGKTTLAETLCRDATQRGVHVLVGRCYDLAETPPYGPWIELLAAYRSTGDLLPPALFRPSGAIGAVTSQAELFDQTRTYLGALAASRPLVLLLDDLHWADGASLDLLRFLGRSLSTLPLVLIATFRDTELTRQHPLASLLPALVRESAAARIELRRIAAADIRTLVDARYVLSEPDALRLTTYLDARSEGNPFFLSELLHTLEAERVLEASAGGWRLGDLSVIRVPTLLRQVIEARVARLDEGTQRLLTVAAVIGQEVPLDLWASVAECDEETLLTAVERTVDAQFVVMAQDGTRVQFVHALIREALYEGILPVRRRVWHHRTGEALATLPTPDPDAVAYHFRAAGDARAYDWLIRAGFRAQRSYAYFTAAERLDAACALMKASESTAGQRGWLLYHLARLRRFADPRRGVAYLDEALALAAASGDRTLAANGRRDRGMILYYADDIRVGLADMAAGVAAMRALTETDTPQTGADIPGPVQSGTGRGEETFALCLAIAGHLTEARTRLEPLLALPAITTSGGFRDGSAYADGQFGLGLVYAAQGLPEEAQRAFTEARHAHEAVGHHVMIGNAAFQELTQVALPYHADDARERARLARMAEQAWTQATLAAPDLNPRLARAPLSLLEGRWEDVEQLTEALPATLDYERRLFLARLARLRGEDGRVTAIVSITHPDGPMTAPGDTALVPALGLQEIAAETAVCAGNLPTAREWLEAHDRWLAWSGAVLGESEGQALWAQYYRAAGDRQRAHTHAERALGHATEPRQPLALLAAHRLLGEFATDAGAYDEAIAHLDAALTLTDACVAPYERALTLLARAAVHVAMRELGAADTFIEEVRRICTPLGALPSLARADALAAQLRQKPNASPTYPAGLSAREVEVLRLVAAGLTNGQIAERLFVSPHTINAHLTTIYAKIGVPSRPAAIRFALDHDLR